jgi:peroxiredoxin
MHDVEAPAEGRQLLGAQIEDFSLPRIGGGHGALAELLAGRRALAVVFWSAVCSHCRRYDAYLNALAARGDVGLAVVASRQGESAAALAAAARERGLAFPILHDADRRLARAWHVAQTPRVFLLDGERRLRYRGAIDNFKYPGDGERQAWLDDAIAAVVAGREVPRAETASFGCPVQSVYYGMPKPLPGTSPGARS